MPVDGRLRDLEVCGDLPLVDVAQVVRELGGIADAPTLVAATSRHHVHEAVRTHQVTRIGRGLFSLPDLDEHPRAAARLHGALDLVSAARHHGWKVKLPPEQPQVLVPRGRNVTATRRRGVELHWGEVLPTELSAGVITPVHTVLRCAQLLPFDAAVAVADSALRAGLSPTTLLLAAAKLPRTGRSRAIDVIEFADKRADNPFESVLRATLRGVPGTEFEPQVWIGNIGRVDLCDRRLRIVVEADSFEFHSEAAALNSDMVRYNAFVGAGYLVLRFGWLHAMFEPDYVLQAVTAVASAQERSARLCPTCRAA